MVSQKIKGGNFVHVCEYLTRMTIRYKRRKQGWCSFSYRIYFADVGKFHTVNIVIHSMQPPNEIREASVLDIVCEVTHLMALEPTEFLIQPYRECESKN